MPPRKKAIKINPVMEFSFPEQLVGRLAARFVGKIFRKTVSKRDKSLAAPSGAAFKEPWKMLPIPIFAGLLFICFLPPASFAAPQKASAEASAPKTKAEGPAKDEKTASQSKTAKTKAANKPTGAKTAKTAKTKTANKPAEAKTAKTAKTKTANKPAGAKTAKTKAANKPAGAKTAKTKAANKPVGAKAAKTKAANKPAGAKAAKTKTTRTKAANKPAGAKAAKTKAANKPAGAKAAKTKTASKPAGAKAAKTKAANKPTGAKAAKTKTAKTKAAGKPAGAKTAKTKAAGKPAEAKKIVGGPTNQAPSPALPKDAKTVLKDFLKMFLDRESSVSDRYNQAVELLEASIYNKASFETLKLLAETYGENKDYPNQIKVLNRLTLAYPDMPEPHYLLGIAHKTIYLEDKTKEKHKELAIESLSEAIKKNRKYTAAYEEVLPLIKERGHTKHSLALVIEMIRYIKKPEHYIELCEAYFETEFFQQSRRACKKSIEKNPEDPKSHILQALSQKKKNKRHKMVVETAGRFSESFFVQKKAGLFFLKQNSALASSYLSAALKLDPEAGDLHEIMALRLFKAEKFKKSYKHFFKACVLSKGRFLKEFRKAKNKLTRLKKNELAKKFKKGFEECFAKSKKEAQKKKNPLTASLI